MTPKKKPRIGTGMPANFGWRYVLWFTWSHAITVLMVLQAIFATLTLDPTLVSHDVFHWLLITNAVLCAVLAQVKRDNPLSKRRKGK
jgi:hypothetical protein